MTMDFLETFLDSGTLLSSEAGNLIVGYGDRQWLPKRRNISKTPLFYFSDYFLKTPHPWFEHESWKEVSVDDILDSLGNFMLSNESIEWNNPHRPLFNAAFEDLQQRFSSGELIKAVPFVYAWSRSHMTPLRLIAMIRSLLNYSKKYPIHIYGFWEGDWGVLGGTPETLFTLEQKHLTTMACAGTRTLGSNREDFLKDSKEQKEHQLVIEGIAQSLSPFGELKIQNQQIVALSSLSHLVTPIELSLNQDVSFDQLVAALHPTPALGAFPRVPGSRWLKGYQQKLGRHYFGAPVGYVMGDSAKCFVAIRNVEWGEWGMRIGAGCGLVQESKKEQEWNEINLKINMIKEMLGL